MQLLIITQKVDKEDGVLGFFHAWLETFSRHFDGVTAVCLEKGSVSLPGNIRVFSLGKERDETKLNYIINFFKIIWRERKRYDAVFVHMNQEYVLLGGIFWKVLGKEVIFWYNHTVGTWKTKLAVLLSRAVCHTSPYAFTAGSRKSVRMPAGIDTELFKPFGDTPPAGSILYVGRISPIKGVSVLLEAMEILKDSSFALSIFGSASPKDRRYERNLRRRSSERVKFFGAVPNYELPGIYNSHEILVNLTPRGNYDKTVLEAAACGALVVVSSKAFADFVPPVFRFKEGDSRSLAKTLEQVSALPGMEKDKLRLALREYVVKNHNLSLLAGRLEALCQK